MGKRTVISKANLARGAAASGLTAGLVAATLTGTGTANAWCVGLSGIDIGSGCASTLGNFALGLGANTVAHSNGLITGAIAFGNDALADSTGIFTAAWGGGAGSHAYTNGSFAWAVAQGTGVYAQAGLDGADIANFAFNFGDTADGATSSVRAGGDGPGWFNLAANLGGNANAGGGSGPEDVDIFAGEGAGNLAFNAGGNRNRVYAGDGFLNLSGTLGNVVNSVAPNGSDNDVSAKGNLTLAFSYQPPFITEPCTVGPCGNTVSAGPNLALAAAIGLVSRTVEQSGSGIEIRTPLNPPSSSTSVLASNSTRKIRPSANFSTTRSSNKAALRAGRAQVEAALRTVDDQVKASVKNFNDQVTKSANKVNDTVRKVTAKLAGDPKAKAAKDAGDD